MVTDVVPTSETLCTSIFQEILVSATGILWLHDSGRKVKAAYLPDKNLIIEGSITNAMYYDIQLQNLLFNRH